MRGTGIQGHEKPDLGEEANTLGCTTQMRVTSGSNTSAEVRVFREFKHRISERYDLLLVPKRLYPEWASASSSRFCVKRALI